MLATMMSNDQSYSVDTVPLLIGINEVQYPILSIVNTSKGQQRAIMPAVLKFKTDIKAGKSLHSKDSDSFLIETKRSIKAGDSIPVFLINGPVILSVEAADGTKKGSKTQPWFTAIAGKPADNYLRDSIECWRIEIDHVGNR